MPHNLNTLTNDELMAAYGDLIGLFKSRGIIRTKNVVGDLGEHLAIAFYNSDSSLPSLTAAPANSTNIDATDQAGAEYSIKSTTGPRSGAFHLPADLAGNSTDPPAFDFLILVRLTDTYCLKQIQQITWQEFLGQKKWSKRQKAWYVPLSRKVLRLGKRIFPQES